MAHTHVELGRGIGQRLKYSLQLLGLIAKCVSQIPFGNLKIVTPYVFNIALFYILIFILNYIFNIYNSKNLHLKKKRIKFLFIRKILCFLLIILLIFNLAVYIYSLLDNSLKLYFIDVGQGDCTLIVTPNNKKILIDGGEDKNEILVKYLLDRKIKQIDFLIISHFDNDHVGGLLNVMEELKVKQVIIGNQYENSENYGKFKEIVNKKRIKVFSIEASDVKKVNIEKNVYLEFLWPSDSYTINENVLNNNSLVVKLSYKSFSMLFTGDIEEVAENKILEQYKNNLSILNSTILKVAHHGSKTSSTSEFLDAVKPKIALIGVEEGNKFGHPNEEVINRLEEIKARIYRTDVMGEIVLRIDNKEKIKRKCN